LDAALEGGRQGASRRAGIVEPRGALSLLALQRRLHLSGKAASSFEAEIEREEAARLALEEADTGLQGTQSINQAAAAEAL